MRIVIQIVSPGIRETLTWGYESTGVVPIPEVGEQIMGYALGELPLKVEKRLYHYMPEAITVKLVCVRLEPEDF